MPKTTLLFLDTEFTGLQQNAQLISLALYKDEENYFYAEFTDYPKIASNDWVAENVITKLKFNAAKTQLSINDNIFRIKNNTSEVVRLLKEWLSRFEIIEIWADVLAYDWVLFCQLFGGAMSIPTNIFYAPFDLATLFRVKNYILPDSQYNTDVSRYDFVNIPVTNHHNALTDAKVEKWCYDKLMQQ